MEHLKSAWNWILAADAALDADQKLSRWTNLAAAVSIVVSVIGWLLSLPGQVALLTGLVAWVALLNTVVARGRGEVRKAEATAAEELEQTKTKLSGVEQERDKLKAEYERITDQKGKELKQRSLDLSPKLLQFTKEREENAPPEATLQISGGFWNTIMESANDPKAQERANYDEETRKLYSEKYGPDVGAVLDDLEQRGWLDSEKRSELDAGIDNPFSPPTQGIRRIAQSLGVAGKKL